MKRKEGNKGFTLIELIVVMAVLAVLVLLAAPKFLGQTKEATFTKHISNAKVLEDASERYYIDHGVWPRGADDAVYTPEEVAAYADKIYDITGEELVLDEGHYWDIDYTALSTYAKLPDEDERANYVLRNPVGTVYYLEGLTEQGEVRVPPSDGTPHDTPTPEEPKELTAAEINALPYAKWVETLEAKGYVMATDADFVRANSMYAPKYSYWRYVGSDAYVIIPDTIRGEKLTDYFWMFGSGSSPTIKGVASKSASITSMKFMFHQSPSTTLDVTHLDTSSVVDMWSMFNASKATSLDLSTFDTRNTTVMYGMFSDSQATTLDLSSFNTANVTQMDYMFRNSQVPILDLSNFDASKAVNTERLFQNAKATTGYARTQADANKLNNSTYKPAHLRFVVKP